MSRSAVVTLALLAGLAFFALGLVLGRQWMPSTGSAEIATARTEAASTTAAPGQGKWRQARDPRRVGGTDRDDETALLLANPYLQGYRRARGGAVILNHDPERSWPGLNLYVSGHAAEAILIDMEGQLRHRWRLDLKTVWPEVYAQQPEVASRLEYWRRAVLLPEGSLVAIYEGLGVVRLDVDSKLLWAYRGGAHHDLFVHGGRVVILDRRSAVVPGINPDRPVLEDLVTELSLADGSMVRQYSIVAAFERSPYRSLLRGIEREGDVFHTNTLERLAASPLAATVPAFRPGNLLLSVLKLDTVAVLDPTREEIVWALPGLWRRQHQPTLLPTGRLLVFDNLGLGDRSRVFELDPMTQAMTWRFPDPPSPAVLFSRTLGSCQRLPNGNTLITESENGRAIEVTADGEIVWELSSPHRAGDEGELVATLFEVVRLDADLDWLTNRDEGVGAATTR